MLAGEQQQLGGHHVAGAVLGPDCGYHNCARRASDTGGAGHW